MKQGSDLVWLIWSNEHGAWWRPNGLGYTRSREEAGRYLLEEALAIVRQANCANLDNSPPMETMVREDCLP